MGEDSGKHRQVLLKGERCSSSESVAAQSENATMLKPFS